MHSLRAATISPEAPSGFLFRWAVTVAKNKARNNAKRAGRQMPLGDDSQPADSVPFSDPLLRSRILECRDRLPIHQRRAFMARCEDGGKGDDPALAVSVGMSRDGFRQNLSRARKALVKCLRSSSIDVMEYSAMNARDRAMLIEEATTAWRPRSPEGQTLTHPAWADLDPAARSVAFEEGLVSRVLEAALDPDGYSTTVRVVASIVARASR